MKKEERIGVEFTTNEGYQVIVIDYANSLKVQVMFLDEHKWTTWTNWGNLQKGNVKNPFHSSVYGVGYLGLNEHGERPITKINGALTREYNLWKDIMRRCYSDKFHEKNPTYKNVTVCKEWHSFSQFLNDLPKIKNYDYWKDNPQQKISLNKDIYYAELGIIADEKEYSLLTTRFITISDNSRERTRRAKRDEKGRYVE